MTDTGVRRYHHRGRGRGSCRRRLTWPHQKAANTERNADVVYIYIRSSKQTPKILHVSVLRAAVELGLTYPKPSPMRHPNPLLSGGKKKTDNKVAEIKSFERNASAVGLAVATGTSYWGYVSPLNRQQQKTMLIPSTLSVVFRIFSPLNRQQKTMLLPSTLLIVFGIFSPLNQQPQ